ncbi:hypothetical protein ACFSE1_02435 [Rhizobium helianthi]|uniref:Transmembrane anchored protein n=1 Tax=Rhizobium helianthi TaxID=1132695 RepID=A0ABW4LZJ3_9HYPH
MVVTSEASQEQFEPLLSRALIYKGVAAFAALMAACLLLLFAGHWFGQRLSLAGHTASNELYRIRIGADTLSVPANVIRLREQRMDGKVERLYLYLTWPQMQGYTEAERARFDEPGEASALIFLDISEATMSRDMSGRLEPIYHRLMTGEEKAFGYGLTLHKMKTDSGYGEEVLLTAPRKDEPDYVVRCVLPHNPAEVTSADCQRDVHLGSGLSVLYRFSSKHISDWKHIDAAIRQFVGNALIQSQSEDR